LPADSIHLPRSAIHPSVRWFFRTLWTDLVTAISHERLDQSRWNLQGIFTSPYWWSY